MARVRCQRHLRFPSFDRDVPVPGIDAGNNMFNSYASSAERAGKVDVDRTPVRKQRRSR